MKAAEWIALAGVIVAALVAVVSAIWAVSQARHATAAQDEADRYRAKAEQHAGRAAQAAEEAAAWQRQSAEAAKQVAAAILEQNRRTEHEAEQAEGVPWRITHRAGDVYEVWNIANTTKFGVQIAGEGVLRPKTVDRVDGQSSVDFFGLNAMGVGDRVEIQWHRQEDLSDEPRQWAGTKPPKP